MPALISVKADGISIRRQILQPGLRFRRHDCKIVICCHSVRVQNFVSGADTAMFPFNAKLRTFCAAAAGSVPRTKAPRSIAGRRTGAPFIARQSGRVCDYLDCAFIHAKRLSNPLAVRVPPPLLVATAPKVSLSVEAAIAAGSCTPVT